MPHTGKPAALRMATVLTIGLAASAAGLSPALAVAAPRAANPAADATLLIRGRGDGHGVGMPQDGALAMGRAGASAATILGTFYPGTTIQKSRGAHLHIAVLAVQPLASAVVLSLPTGGSVIGPAGTITVPAAGRVSLAQDSGGWAATLLGPPVGSGGRGVPLSGSLSLPGDDDPSDPPATATDSPTPAASPPSDASTAPAPTDASASTPDPGPSSAHPAASSPTTTPAANPIATPPAPVTSMGTSTHHASQQPTPGPVFGQLEPTSPSPSRAKTATATHALTRTTVRGAELRVVPQGGGITSLDAQGRSYRGELVTAPGQLVDDITVEQYLLGLGEVRDPDWPPAALQAQVIAARTYALRAALAADDAATPAHVNFCATDVCQVYLGAGAEYPALTQAVHATDHLAVLYQHQLAATYYSASGGGETATPAEGFGPGSTAVPYLVPVTYDTGGGDGWQRSLDPAAAAHSLGYAGSLTSIEVTTRGPSARVTTAVLHGSAGDVPMTGLAVEAALKLPSTLFDTGVGVAAPSIGAVADTSVASAVGVAFPANEPAAVQVAPSVPLPEIAPSDVGVPAPVAPASAVTDAGADATLRATFGLVVSAASQVSALDPTVRPSLVPTTGPVRLAAYRKAHDAPAYPLLSALLGVFCAVGAGIAWRRRRA